MCFTSRYYIFSSAINSTIQNKKKKLSATSVHHHLPCIPPLRYTNNMSRQINFTKHPKLQSPFTLFDEQSIDDISPKKIYRCYHTPQLFTLPSPASS
ncbi:hypothetical protein Hanom_Chr03g00230991 [Helianthus anomalus]